jgi:acetoin utilization deacetylase AcuC-like enzyme
LPTVIVQEGGYDVDRLGNYVVGFLKEFAAR